LSLTMVEVKFDAVSKMDLSDCYVAVRIGEVQKLARLPASKALSFPKAGDRHFGKVEVYRRIGGCGVDFDPMKAGDRQVSMDCGAAGDLRLNIAVEGTKGPEAATDADPTAAGGAREKAAKEYLRKHSVELQLSEAMQCLLKEKPDDPIDFLVSKLLGNQGVGLPAKKASGKAGERARERSRRPAKLETIKEKASPVELTSLELPSAPTAAEQHEELGKQAFGRYHEEHFSSACADAALGRLYAKFPSARESTPPHLPKAEAAFALRPSVGTWLAPRPPAVRAPAASKASGPEASGGARFALLPSVGTWLSSRVSKAAAPAPADPASPPSSFALKPSVGTWLAPRPAMAASRAIASTSFALTPSAGTKASGPAVSSPKAALAEAAADSSFQLLPSVGTWLARPASTRKAAAPMKDLPLSSGSSFQLLPSVGTWLAPRPAACVQKSTAGEKEASERSLPLVSNAVPPKRHAAFVTSSAALSLGTMLLGMSPRMLFV